MKLLVLSQRILFFAISFFFLTNFAQAQSYCVRKSDTPLFDSSSKTKEIYLAAKYTPLMGTGEKKSGMLEVKDSSGATLWVKPSQVTTDISCLIVKVNKSRLRNGPGKEFDANDTTEKGQSFKDIGGEDGWTQVENSDGGKAWLDLDHAWKPRSKFRMSFDPE